MGKWNISLVVLLQYFVLVDKGFAEVRTAFETAGIVPNIVSVGPELMKLMVTYPSGVSVELGNELTPTQTRNEPIVLWPGQANDDGLYTIILFDPDATSADLPILSDFIHWLVGNIPGQQVQSGEMIARYAGPSPPPLSGFHRYIFLVYRQPSRLVFDELSLLDGQIFIRSGFSVRDFVAKYNLGDPTAGNFFRSKSDGVGTVINVLDGIAG